MLQLCINWECVGGLRLTLPGVLQLEQPWELYCHIRGYSYNPRGAQTLAHPALQSLMNYATEAVFILLSVPLAWISVSYLFWQEEGGLQSWLCVPVKDVRILESRLAGGGRLCMSLWVSMRLRWCPENDGQGCLSASARPFQAGAMKLEPSSQGLQDWSTPHTHQHHSAIPFFPPFSFQSFSRCSFSFNTPYFSHSSLPFFYTLLAIFSLVLFLPSSISCCLLQFKSATLLSCFIPATQLLFRKAPSAGSLQCLCFCQRQQRKPLMLAEWGFSIDEN